MSIPGYGGNLSTVGPFLEPLTGSIRGGTEFVILNSGITLVPLCDTFPGVSLDAGKWNTIDIGAGNISINDSLILTLPVSAFAGMTGISSVATFGTFDTSVYFSYDRTVEQFTPVQQITYLTVRATIDANNHFDISSIWNPLRGTEVSVTVTQDGVTTLLQSYPSKGSDRYLRLVRYNGHMQAYAGANLILDFMGWRNDLVNIDVAIITPVDIPRDTQVVVTEVLFRPVVTFKEEICQQADEYAGRIIGAAPPYALPEPTQVSVHGDSSSIDIAQFTYTPPLQLSLNAQGTLVIDNDDTLRDSNTELKGLRL